MIVSAEKVLAVSGMGPVGEDSAAVTWTRDGKVVALECARAGYWAPENPKRKSGDNSAAHFPIAANARTDEFCE